MVSWDGKGWGGQAGLGMGIRDLWSGRGAGGTNDSDGEDGGASGIHRGWESRRDRWHVGFVGVIRGLKGAGGICRGIEGQGRFVGAMGRQVASMGGIRGQAGSVAGCWGPGKFDRITRACGVHGEWL